MYLAQRWGNYPSKAINGGGFYFMEKIFQNIFLIFLKHFLTQEGLRKVCHSSKDGGVTWGRDVYSDIFPMVGKEKYLLSILSGNSF